MMSGFISDKALLLMLDFKYQLHKRLPSKLSRSSSGSDSSLPAAYKPDKVELRRVFDRIDQDKDGIISLKDLLWLFRSLNHDTRLLVTANFVKDSPISFSDFMHLHNKGMMVDDMQEAFFTYDLDKDGKIGVRDLKGTLLMLGECCSDEECRRMIKKVDKDQDGFIGKVDFMTMMTQKLQTQPCSDSQA